MEAFQFFNFFKQRLCIFCQKLSNENKQRLYKIQKSPTSLFYHVLLIKQNECIYICFISNAAIGKPVCIFSTPDCHCFWMLIFGKIYVVIKIVFLARVICEDNF